jgi:hypothetical protein
MKFVELVPRRLLTRRWPDPGFQKLDPNVSIPFDATRAVAFMHIPKTSGTAIASGLAAALAPAVMVEGFDHCLFGTYQDFDSLDRSIRCTIYDSPAHLPQPVDLIAGHFAFSTLRQSYPGAQLLTILREPYSRLLSHWLFWRQHTDTDLAPWGTWAKHVRKARQQLTSFLKDPAVACQSDNLMLRMLLWPHPLLPPSEFIDPIQDEQLLQKAIARLQEFDFIDIVENDAVLHNLRRCLGRSLIYRRVNDTKPIPQQYRSPLYEELTCEALDLLEMRSRLDVHLWTHIAKRRLPSRDVYKLRQQTILANIAHYSILIS